MSRLRIALFGRFNVEDGTGHPVEFESLNAQKLFGYLLVFSGRPHRREKLADELWQDASAGQAGAYLRKALWQLQSTLSEYEDEAASTLHVDGDWIGLNPGAECTLDVAEFEQLFSQTCDCQGYLLTPEAAELLERAVNLYHGELLEGWYDEWCLLERERLTQLYLIMLGKLTEFCEAHNLYEKGLNYCMLMLRHDRANEKTHRRLMRLHYSAGNRTAALHQYEQCTEFLSDELDVAPSPRTTALYQQIRSGRPNAANLDNVSRAEPENLHIWYQQLLELQGTLDMVRQAVNLDLKSVELLLTRMDQSPGNHENT